MMVELVLLQTNAFLAFWNVMTNFLPSLNSLTMTSAIQSLCSRRFRSAALIVALSKTSEIFAMSVPILRLLMMYCYAAVRGAFDNSLSFLARPKAFGYCFWLRTRFH